MHRWEKPDCRNSEREQCTQIIHFPNVSASQTIWKAQVGPASGLSSDSSQQSQVIEVKVTRLGTLLSHLIPKPE